MDSEKKKPLLLFRVTSRKYAEEFKKGNLYLNSLHFFKGIEDKGEEMTGDYLEGGQSLTQATEFDVFLDSEGNVVGTTEDVIGGVHRPDPNSNFLKVLCLYELKYDWEAMTVEKIDDRILDFGDSYVLIENVNEFIRRLDLAVTKLSNEINLPVLFGPIVYYDEMKYSGKLDTFKKRQSYSWQNEWRVGVDLKDKTTDGYPLSIGDLSDITKTGSITNMIKNLKFIDENTLHFEQGYEKEE